MSLTKCGGSLSCSHEPLAPSSGCMACTGVPSDSKSSGSSGQFALLGASGQGTTRSMVHLSARTGADRGLPLTWKDISHQSKFISFEIKFNFWGQASSSPMFSLLLSSLLPAPSPPPSSILLLPLLLLPYIHLVIAFVIAIVIAFMIAFVIAFCDSNFGPDQLHNVIHFNIRSTFDLCMRILS